MTEQSEIVLYRPDETLSLDVRVADDTVWLSQQQMAELFQTTRNNVTLHIRNVFKEGELHESSVCKESLLTAADGKKYKTKLYNLDVIISVGYRVKSQRGTQFRQWANGVLKQYLLTGAAVHHQIVALQERLDDRMSAIESRQDEQQQQLDFFIRTSTPPAEMVFFDGDFFEARVLLERLVKTAIQRVVLIDGYVDAATFDILDVRADGVEAVIYTHSVGEKIVSLQELHNEQQGAKAVEVRKWKTESHDRWLIVDDRLYHCGHSIKDLGRKISAITLMGESPETILEKVS